MPVSPEQVFEYLRKAFPIDFELIEDGEAAPPAWADRWKRVRAEDTVTGIDEQVAHKLDLIVELLREVAPRPAHTEDDIKIREICMYLSSALADYRALSRSQRQASHGACAPFRFPDNDNRGREGHFIAILLGPLRKCPTREASPDTDVFGVVGDELFRRHLLEDLKEMQDTLKAQNWKAATVLGGSLIEALLFHCFCVIRDKEPERLEKAVQTRRKDEAQSLEEFGLSQLVAVAKDLGLISKRRQETINAKGNLRNLIHPGKSVREERRCSRGQAYEVYGELLGLEEHLKEWFTRYQGP